MFVNRFPVPSMHHSQQRCSRKPLLLATQLWIATAMVVLITSQHIPQPLQTTSI
ncbi:hypothetical protein M404DRAFT_997735, partial [Pisolithus tinctorius Marx 270]